MTVLKRSVMTLYSGPLDIYSHQIRIVLAEKGVSVDIVHVEPDEANEDLIQLNPYNTLPTLVDRDLVLYQNQVIMEYLDERFPHPPLLPVYPVMRAKSRLMLYRIEHDWYSLYKIANGHDYEKAEKAKKELRDSILSLAPVFSDMPYFLSEEFTLVDCSIAALLWRFDQMGIDFGPTKPAKAIIQYAERMFQRDAFQVSLSEAERELREKCYDT